MSHDQLTLQVTLQVEMKLILHSQLTKAPTGTGSPHGRVATHSCLRYACTIGTRLVQHPYNSAATPLDSLPPLVLFLCSSQPHEPASRAQPPDPTQTTL